MKNVLYILRGVPFFGECRRFFIVDWAKMKNGSWMLFKLIGPNQRRKLLTYTDPKDRR